MSKIKIQPIINNELSSDDRHKYFSAKYGRLLHDTSLTLEERKLKKLIAKTIPNQADQEKEYLAVCQSTRDYLTGKLRDFSLLTYLSMRQRQDYGTMGEERTIVSLTRSILNIYDREVNQWDVFRVENLLAECANRYAEETGGDYQNYLKNYNLVLFSHTYCHDLWREINHIFFLLESDDYLFRYANSDYGSEFIYGKVKILKKEDDERAFLIENEYVTSPLLTHTLAGRVYNNTMIIRKSSVNIIAHNKWSGVFKQTKAELKEALKHVNSSIREGLKYKALEHYGVKNSLEFNQNKEIWIEDMVTGLFYHENGHLSANAEMNPIHKALYPIFYGADNIGSALVETLADYLPEKGPFAKFLALSKTDKRRACGNIYVYMSDNWFLDEDEVEEKFRCQSLLLIGLVYLFLNPDGSVNFERLEKDKKNIYISLTERFKDLCDRLISIFQHALYNLGDRVINYKTLENEIYDFFQYGRFANSLERLYEYTIFWEHIFQYLKKFSKEGYDEYQKLMFDMNLEVEQMILGLAQSNEKSLEDFIRGRSKENGVIQVLPNIDEYKAVKKACEALNLPASVQKKVRSEVKRIIDGKTIVASITENFDGDADPFLTVLQEMMINSGYGGIESPILLGEFYEPYATSEEIKEYIKSELENLRDKIEGGMLDEITKLNVSYQIRYFVDELLAQVKFSNEESLSSKVKAIEYNMETENDAFMEVFVPIKRGFMDSNTALAVSQINQNIRPNEWEQWLIIDRFFLYELIEAYLHPKTPVGFDIDMDPIDPLWSFF